MAHLRAAAKAAVQHEHDRSLATGVSLVHNPTIAFERLKAYVKDLRNAGLTELAKKLAANPDEACNSPPLLQLATSTQYTYKPPTSDMLSANAKFKDDEDVKLLAASDLYSQEHGAAHLVEKPAQDDIEAALKTYCLLVEAVAKRGGKFVLDGSKVTYKGGFDKKGYDKVNLPEGVPFQNTEQQKVVFAVGKGDVKRFVRDFHLHWVVNYVHMFVNHDFGRDWHVIFAQIHAMFSFSVFTHYPYHNDVTDLRIANVGDGDGAPFQLTVLTTVSPGRASFHVAGFDKEVEYRFPGDIKVFPSGMFHRSGSSSFRTVKLAFFLTLRKPVDLEKEEAEAPVAPSVIIKVTCTPHAVLTCTPHATSPPLVFCSNSPRPSRQGPKRQKVEQPVSGAASSSHTPNGHPIVKKEMKDDLSHLLSSDEDDQPGEEEEKVPEEFEEEVEEAADSSLPNEMGHDEGNSSDDARDGDGDAEDQDIAY